MRTDLIAAQLKHLEPTRDELLYMLGILIERVPEDVSHAMDSVSRQRTAKDMSRRSG
jgi:hypothetical protein